MMLPGEDKKNTIKDKVLGVGAMFRFSVAKLLSEAKEKEKVKDKDADLPHRHTHTFFQRNAFLWRLRANPRVTNCEQKSVMP